METKIKIDLNLGIKLLNSKKDFILYNLNNNKITNYKLTNDLTNRNQFKHFKAISCIKTNLQTITI